MQGLDKVRDVSLSLKFGSSQVDLSLDFGCSDGAAAGQLAQGIQGLLGMLQLGAQKTLGSMPPFVARIKAGAEGAVFRIVTAFTIRDFDVAFQNASRGVAAAGPRVSSPTPKPDATPPTIPELPPVDVEFVQFKSDLQESLRPAKMRVQNRSSKPVKELNLTFTYSDQSGRKLGQWTRSHSSLVADNLIDGGITRVVDCLAFSVPAVTKKVTVTLHEMESGSLTAVEHMPGSAFCIPASQKNVDAPAGSSGMICVELYDTLNIEKSHVRSRHAV
jgi:hypothetical protein